MDLTDIILKLRQKKLILKLKQSDCEKLYINIVKNYDKLNNIDMVKCDKLDFDEKKSVKNYILTNLTEETKINIIELYNDIYNLKKCDMVLDDIISKSKCLYECNHYRSQIYTNEILYKRINCIFEIKTDVLKRISKIKNINENKNNLNLS